MDRAKKTTDLTNVTFLASAKDRRLTRSFRHYNPVSDFRLYFVILEVTVTYGTKPLPALQTLSLQKLCVVTTLECLLLDSDGSVKSKQELRFG